MFGAEYFAQIYLSGVVSALSTPNTVVYEITATQQSDDIIIIKGRDTDLVMTD